MNAQCAQILIKISDKTYNSSSTLYLLAINRHWKIEIETENLIVDKLIPLNLKKIKEKSVLEYQLFYFRCVQF